MEYTADEIAEGLQLLPGTIEILEIECQKMGEESDDIFNKIEELSEQMHSIDIALADKERHLRKLKSKLQAMKGISK